MQAVASVPTRRIVLGGLWLLAGGGAHAMAPDADATFDLYGGGVLSLDQLRGRIVVLSFWATWCAPCRQDLAEIDALVRAHPKQVAAVAILAERRPDPRLLADAAAALRIPVAMRIAPGGRRLPLVNNGVPTTYLLDPVGRVAFVKAGLFAPGELRERLRALLDAVTD